MKETETQPGTQSVGSAGSPRPERDARGTVRFRRHAPAIVATLLLAGVLLVTQAGVVAFLQSIGAERLVPLADEVFGAPAQEGGDKLVHVLLFLLYTSTLVRSLAGMPGAASEASAASAFRSRALAAGALSFAYGAALEVCQGMVGRHEDPWDLVANGVGVALCLTWRLLRSPGSRVGSA